ncbi:hypothetical protein HMPREF2600_02015 [Neisseria sp. HMSC077D05]|uniref:hypothetical protein n=1 Tax=Neisseria sp. HMSC077D05 TaxID=1715079 RepID=UPI0008A37C7B|nr:hypothetical protein [Neisseria sp. HMSC077D05]OFN28666.1 hypothetical protein HMPREF2600_02015 [Neisseria sp. HMSC077D05]
MFDVEIKESINKLREYSYDFVKFYKNDSRDDVKRVSKEAIKCLDFIVNEILRIRDNYKEAGIYRNSDFSGSLREYCGKEYQSANVTERQSIIRIPILPNPNTSIRFESMITKFKHRERAHFRIEVNNSHIIIFSARAFNDIPASIVEFNVQDFCQKAENVAKYI